MVSPLKLGTRLRHLWGQDFVQEERYSTLTPFSVTVHRSRFLVLLPACPFWPKFTWKMPRNGSPAVKVVDVDGYDLWTFPFEEALLSGVFKVRNISELLGWWCDGGRLSEVGRPWHSKTFCSPCCARAWHGPLPCERRAGAGVFLRGEDGGGVGSLCTQSAGIL